MEPYVVVLIVLALFVGGVIFVRRKQGNGKGTGDSPPLEPTKPSEQER